MSPILSSTLARLAEPDRAALSSIVKRNGRVRRTAPSWRDDPAGWAAWQGLRSAEGLHNEIATRNLMLLDDEHRAAWGRVCNAAVAARREIAGY